MKAKKWIIAALTALMCLCLGLFVSACGEAKNYGFEDYGYNNGTNENDWTKLEYPDTDITVDGVVNTTEYGDKFLSFSDVNGINMKVYAHMGQEGVFFGFVSDDTAVFYDAKDVYNNTSIEIQVAPAGTEKLNPNVVQLRLGANGYAEQWVGMKAHDTKYDYTRKYIPSMGRIRINGQLNSAECEGYSMEIYMPYTSLNLDSKPDSIVCAPSFNTKAAPAIRELPGR